MFFTELAKEASEIAGCFNSKARHLLRLHVSNGLLGYVRRLRLCFTDDQQTLIQEGRVLIEYITMNAIAIRKILKKYDKVSTIMLEVSQNCLCCLDFSKLFGNMLHNFCLAGSLFCKW